MSAVRSVTQVSTETWTTTSTGPNAVWQLKERTIKPAKPKRWWKRKP